MIDNRYGLVYRYTCCSTLSCKCTQTTQARDVNVIFNKCCPTGMQYPDIDILAEYGALTIGHACRHNIIVATAVGAGMAVKYAMEKYDFRGTIRIVGTPAKEYGRGKVILQKTVYLRVQTLL